VEELHHLDRVLEKVVDSKGQDLFLKVGTVPRARVGGELVPLPFVKVEEKYITAILNAILNPTQREALEKYRSVDFAFSAATVGQRFRGNAFFQHGTYSIVIRRLWKQIPSFEELLIPPVLKNITAQRAGIILLGGTVGSGKTTTINAMVDYMNRNTRRHIITIEDPVEYIHEDDGCIINQREIGQDANDYRSALRYVVRQSPDVVMIGEMRDAETFNFALQASEVGRLVISSIHVKSVPHVFDRILGFFEKDKRDAVLNHLSYHLTCFAVERLLVKQDRKTLVPAFEIMVGTPIIQQLVRERDFGKIHQALRNGAHEGMQTMDQSIFKLWEEKLISSEEAMSACDKPFELEKRMKGIHLDGQNASILGS
jgi:twitching motility protein PilU